MVAQDIGANEWSLAPEAGLRTPCRPREQRGGGATGRAAILDGPPEDDQAEHDTGALAFLSVQSS